MKKQILLALLVTVCMLPLFGQNTADELMNSPYNSLYVNTILNSKDKINNLSRDFSVDAWQYDERTGQYVVRVALAQQEYASFAALNLPFEMIPFEEERAGMVATTLAELTGSWNQYPSYPVYVELMQQFQANFPDICKIDTILQVAGNTNRPHSILAAHISTSLGQQTTKPAFLYSSTMHGDEVVGFYMMLRLIDYILNNATTDPAVQNILANIDLWICPLENPDGTYYRSDTQISSSYSQRYNYRNVDLNRNYPFLPGISGSANVQAETQAMIEFVSDKYFVMSANLHGGAEVANFPWDSWASNSRTHADDAWFRYVSQNYVDACQAMDPTFMTGSGANAEITEGGDWYVITGSRQDYMNYYQHCREVTLEVGTDKVVTSNSELPTYWTNSKEALLNYIMECNNGFHGIVTDAVTGDPIEAKIFVRNHDNFGSEVYSHLPTGKYHRPIKGGTYTVEVSADCYETQTFTVTTTDGAGITRDVQLQPLVAMPTADDQHIFAGETATFTASSTHDIYWYNTPTATSPLHVGNTYTTPALNETTTFYLEEVATDNDVTCRSERNSVTAFVSVAPIDTVYGYLEVGSCPPFTYEGQVFATSGIYRFLYPDAGVGGLDSVLYLNLTIYPTYNMPISITVAEGETYMIGDEEFTAQTAGTYTYDRAFQTVHGCDSICHYYVYVTSTADVYSDLIVESCPPYIYEGEVLPASGDYPFVYSGAAHTGGDSILFIHLTIYPTYDTTVNVELTLGETYMTGNELFTASIIGGYHITKHLQSIYGCDSTVHYNIEVVNSVSVQEMKSAHFAVYPNPTNSYCWIESGEMDKNAVAFIYDVEGKCVATFKLTEKRTKIDLRSLNNGFYFIRIAEEEYPSVTLKIIKQ